MGRDEKHAEDIMVAWSLRLSFQGLEPCIGAAESLRPWGLDYTLDAFAKWPKWKKESF